MEMLLPERKSRRCTLQKVLHVLKLAHNLVSVSRVPQTGNYSTTLGASLLIAEVRLLPLPQDTEASTIRNSPESLRRKIKGKTKRSCGTTGTDT